MAAGEFTVFNNFLEVLGDNLFDLNTSTIKLGIIDNVVTPDKTEADPRWSTYSANEITPGGNYSAGGLNLTTVITDPWSRSAAITKLDIDDLYIAQNASNPPEGARWGILYIDDANDYCIGFVDFSAELYLTAGDLNIYWDTGGILTLTNP